jgi:hypothetical protein
MKTTAVKKQAAAADALHKEVYGDQSGQPEGDNQLPQEPAEPQEKAEGADGTKEPVPELAEVEQSAGTTVVEDAPDFVPPVEPVEPAPEAIDYEHKYKTLQGMYTAEVPRLQTSLKEANEKIESLENILASINKPVEGTATPLVTGAEIEDYGEDLISVVKRAAREELSAELGTLKQDNLNLRKQLGENTASVGRTSRETLFDNLLSAVPNWQEVNTNDNFVAWLQNADAYSGQSRQLMLNEAFEKNDAPRVVAFFQGFLNEAQVVSPQPTPAAVEQPTVSLDTLVAPGPGMAGDSGRAPETSDTKIFTSAEVQGFYRDVNRGAYKSNPDEKARIEGMIIKAGREGRVQ